MMFYIFVAIFGLCIGSFVSAVSYRIPQNISFVKGRSICPKCKTNISWFDNIPLLSYILLKGKCRKCKRHISIRYPVIELITSIGFLSIVYLTLPDYFKTIIYLILFSLLLMIFVIDLEHQIIPDSLSFIGIVIIFIYIFIFDQGSLFPGLLSGFTAASFLMIINIFTKGRGMGLGDVKFAVLGGLITGLNLMPIWLLLSFLTGGTLGSILILVGKAGFKTKIAFGPFLILGLLFAIIFGDKIMNLIGFPFI